MTDEASTTQEDQVETEEPAAESAPQDDRYLRLAADFDNYRKRMAREQLELTKRAAERLVSELLPVLDDLERALEAAEQHEEAKLEEAAERPVRDSGPGEGARGNREVPSTNSSPGFDGTKLLEGVRLVHRSLADALRREGLAEIETSGQFDPHVHEALLSQPSEAEEGSIVQVIQKGYRLGDRILRPARVAIAAPKTEE